MYEYMNNVLCATLKSIIHVYSNFSKSVLGFEHNSGLEVVCYTERHRINEVSVLFGHPLELDSCAFIVFCDLATSSTYNWVVFRHLKN
jgi:hypothetical protein